MRERAPGLVIGTDGGQKLRGCPVQGPDSLPWLIQRKGKKERKGRREGRVKTRKASRARKQR